MGLMNFAKFKARARKKAECIQHTRAFFWSDVTLKLAKFDSPVIYIRVVGSSRLRLLVELIKISYFVENLIAEQRRVVVFTRHFMELNEFGIGG
jgi:hypothetical protein